MLLDFMIGNLAYWEMILMSGEDFLLINYWRLRGEVMADP